LASAGPPDGFSWLHRGFSCEKQDLLMMGNLGWSGNLGFQVNQQKIIH
jgi:hypothetical protein